MLSNRRRKTSARKVELSRRVIEHCVSGHDYPFLDFAAGIEERSLSDVADVYFANSEFIEAKNRKERGLFTRSAAWWELVGVPRYGPRKQIAADEYAEPIPERGHCFGIPRCWTDRPKASPISSLFEFEKAYLIRHGLLTEEEQR